jgi:cell cycle arrest protein BUB2
MNLLHHFPTDAPSSRLSPLTFSYVQGMNVLLAPIVYTMPELDSFFAFSSLITEQCPMYVQQSLEGAHCGMKVC